MWSPAHDFSEDNNGGVPEPTEGDEQQDAEEADEMRRVWVWVHPAAAKEATRELTKACWLDGAPWVGSVEVRFPYVLRRTRCHNALS